MHDKIDVVLYELGILADKFAHIPTSNVYRQIKWIETLVNELKEGKGE